jgi:Sphingosine kinase and enzymes related to eukaryotic diacylglycerol kinase
MNLNLKNYDGIVIVGGDGLVHEVINALCNRKSENPSQIPLGVIPAGSGNALAQYLCASINEKTSLISSAFIIIKGKGVPFDVSKVLFESGKIVHSFLSVT